MGSTGKDTAQHYPQIGHRTELGSHDGPEDGACSSDVQELYHENLPVGKHDIVYTVSLGHGWCYTVVRTEHTLHETSIEQITQKQSQQAQCE